MAGANLASGRVEWIADASGLLDDEEKQEAGKSGEKEHLRAKDPIGGIGTGTLCKRKREFSIEKTLVQVSSTVSHGILQPTLFLSPASCGPRYFAESYLGAIHPQESRAILLETCSEAPSSIRIR